MRLRHKPWAREEIQKRPHIVVQEPGENRGKWKGIFGDGRPLHVEVGTGKGQFLTEMAKLHPATSFIGVERYESVLLTAMERVEQEDLENVKLLSEDVANLRDFFAPREVDRFYINFTDPWPKKRHEKRRLTHEGFLKLYEEVLTPGGDIHVKTDNQTLFEYSLHSFSKYGLILNNVSLDLHNSEMEGNVLTEYEERFVAKGLPIYRLEAVLRSSSNA
ncbi:tRNA (guanosine(46)-N7)-methyltransferase TrmB [Shouchella shacheensis]|uniref:tRNA (guanosine(46)-N7)-methyltransferase TrmB n=1 Tax=Shouchella shacheensis TaxID=1649580 RepID=UPI00073FC53F|nr:tRNA (guanosine(46)-N7)-methyltransferase TrmB [Shouchella shacheensis]